MDNLHFTLTPIDYSLPYDQQPDCKRHVIGAYANLARHNLTLAVNTIMQAIGMDTFDEDEIENAFSNKHCKIISSLDNIQKVRLQQRLYRHFTFLKRMKLEGEASNKKKVKDKSSDMDKKQEEKKSVQLQTLLEVMSDFTTCMADIRNFYTHFHPYNTQKEMERQQKLQEKMGERLTDLFENSCQMLKKREHLKHEDNEVFYTQREEVKYTYYWFVEQNLPAGKNHTELIDLLRTSPSKKMVIGDIEYKLHEDGFITGIRRQNGKKHRFFWNFNEKDDRGGSYDDLKEDISEAMNKSIAMPSSVRLNNKTCSFVGEKGIKQEWKQFDRDPDYYATMSDPEKGLSDVGLLYFLCLFLDKSVAFELMEEVGFTRQCTFTAENAGENIDILQELMCLNRIRMVKSKLDSEMTETALALDMLNEVRKCPKQLYEVFSKKAREEFQDDATVNWEENHPADVQQAEHNDDEQPESETFESVNDDEERNESTEKETPKSTFVRWQDRFPQMALRYIDVRGLLEDIRFQLNLGKYRFAFYTHDSTHSIDGKERLRILQQELHGFGRIQEVELKVKDLWKDLFEKKFEKDGLTQKVPDVAGQAPYVTEQKPQYAIDEKSHSIGLRWEGWDNGCRQSGRGELIQHHVKLDSDKLFIPYLPTSPVAPSDGGRQQNQAERLLPPQAMMSLYDLPGLIFYQYLLEKNGQNHHLAEQLIKDNHAHLTAFLNDVSNGTLQPLSIEAGSDPQKVLEAYLMEHYGLRLADIPKKLRRYLQNKAVDIEKKLKESAYERLTLRKDRIKRALQSYREKRKRIGSKDNKYDKLHATIKTGALAKSLMRDIMDWLPLDSEARQKLTGQSYMALQAAFAVFGQEFEDEDGHKQEMTKVQLRTILVKAKVLDEKTEGIDQKRFHPFLHLVFRDCKGNSVEPFYEMYLEKEIKKIDNVLEFLDGAGDSYAKLHERYRYVPFLHHERVRWTAPDAQAMPHLAARYLELPLQLPDGLFTRAIYALLKELPQNRVPEQRWCQFQQKLTEADLGEPHLRLSNNVSYLINLYFNEVENDHSQPFYLTEPIDGTPSPYLHIYRVFKKFYGVPIGRTNQKTSPALTIEKLRRYLNDKEDITQKIKEYVDKEVKKYEENENKKFQRNLSKFKEKQRKELKAEKLPSGKPRWKWNEISAEVERRVQQAIDEIQARVACYREQLTKKQERMFRKVNDNERAIRRFKTQDILLLMMARQILKAKSTESDFESTFCLKYVMSDSLLDKTIDFDWEVYIDSGSEKPVKKTIRQEGMKMKDYGNFYKFLSDKKRLATLLARMPLNVFKRAEIENEFSYYDSNRSAVFRLVYEIEYEAYKLCPMLKVDANSEPKEEGNSFYYKDKKSGKLIPKRNNFMSLLEILAAGEDHILSDEEKRIMQSIRNSISHNTYEVDFEAVFEGRKDHMKLPEVANGIKIKIENDTDELKARIETKD